MNHFLMTKPIPNALSTRFFCHKQRLLLLLLAFSAQIAMAADGQSMAFNIPPQRLSRAVGWGEVTNPNIFAHLVLDLCWGSYRHPNLRSGLRSYA